MANSSRQIAFRPYVTWKLGISHTLMDRDIHTWKERAKTLNRLDFWFLAGSASFCLQTFDDKWPSTHLKWESSQRNAVIVSFFTKQLKRKKFPPDRTADQTEPPAKDICSRRHNCHCFRWLIHEQYVVWAVGPCCKGEIEQQGTAHCWSCSWWLFGIVWSFPGYTEKNPWNKTTKVSKYQYKRCCMFCVYKSQFEPFRFYWMLCCSCHIDFWDTALANWLGHILARPSAPCAVNVKIWKMVTLKQLKLIFLF